MRVVTIVTLLALALVGPTMVQAKTAKARRTAGKRPATKAVSPEKINQQFETFCQEWMQKLAAREHDNLSKIKWNSNSGGVEGEYVGYTQDHTCTVKGDDSAPVGKIAYQEVRYAKRGATIADAEKSPPQAMETTAVTELFRYEKGKWIY